MNDTLENFLNACRKVCDELEVIFALEQTKRQALLSYDIKEVEAISNKQQALYMKLENLEKKRLDCQNLAGFPLKSTSEIVELLNFDDKIVFKEVFDKLYAIADGLKISNKASMDIISIELNILKDRLPVEAQPTSILGKKGYTTYGRSSFNGTV